MSEFKRRRGESASAWCVRLGAVDMAALSPAQVDDLTLRRVLAGRALQREARRRRKHAPDGTDGDGLETKAFRRCLAAVLALSAEERRRLKQWLDATFTD